MGRYSIRISRARPRLLCVSNLCQLKILIREILVKGVLVSPKVKGEVGGQLTPWPEEFEGRCIVRFLHIQS